MDRRPKLAINEWGLDIPESQQCSIVAALYGARLMNVFERQSDLVAMSAVSDLVNGWPGGIIQAGRHGVFVTPIYLVNRLRDPPRRGAAGHCVDGPIATTREGNEIPVLDFTASRSADGRRIFVKAVNTDLHWPLSARVELRGAQVSPDAIVKRVVADSLSAVNGFATPEAVRVTQNPLRAGNAFRSNFPTLRVGRHAHRSAVTASGSAGPRQRYGLPVSERMSRISSSSNGVPLLRNRS